MISSIVNDTISFLLSLVVLSYCLYTVDVVAIFGCMMAVVVPMIIKKVTKRTPYPGIFKRPDGAVDCNLFNTGGICDRESGFPSGHVTLISYFCFYIYYKYNATIISYLYGVDIYEKDSVEIKQEYVDGKKKIVLFLCVLPIIMMGYARYMKNCHNIVQILAGSITGFCITKLIIKLDNLE